MDPQNRVALVASWTLMLFMALALSACRRDDILEPTPGITPLPTNTPTPASDMETSEGVVEEINFITVATDAPSRFQDFEDIDPFGNVVGFDPDLMNYMAARAGIDYEFVVTSFEGLLESVANHEFDAAMSALLIPEQPVEGLAYTQPYLEVGQVLVVRANETVLLNYSDVEAGIPIGAQRHTSGEQVARAIIGLQEPDLQLYDSTSAALQALIDGEVEGVVIDNDDAEHFTNQYPRQLKIAGGTGRQAWISGKSYGIAVASDNEALLKMLNEAIDQSLADGTRDQLVQNWLVSGESIVAGESLVGTPADELVIGVVGELTSLEPAAGSGDFVDWDVKSNTMSGLMIIDEDSNLVPMLAADFPLISEERLEYTFTLRPDLLFPDGSTLDAEDVKYSIERASMLGNYLVNSYLKDDNDDGFADADAVQVIDPLTVKIFLQEPPVSYFTNLLASPPYFIVNRECYLSNPDPGINCQGLGKYTIEEWEQGQQIRLETNPTWPGTPPLFDKIQIRFYDEPGRMQRSLENSAIDVAWTGITADEIRELTVLRAFSRWEGPSVFKSYLVFEQSTEPWDNEQLRQAVALAVDRQELAEAVFQGARLPLYSPVPDGVPGQINAEKIRNLEQARAILTAAGYSAEDKLVVDLWYEDGGRYSQIEGEYAEAIKSQLEETGLVEVILQSAPYSIYRPQSATCNYPLYLLGWPSPGQPASYLDAMSWMEYFITDTESVCSNYESEEMDALYEAALEETDPTSRLEIYMQIQELWADELPTLDLIQEPRVAVALPNVSGIVIDAAGLLHFDMLNKSSE